MSHSSANEINNCRRPRAPSLNLQVVRNVRPQMRTASMPPGMTLASAQPTRPPAMVGSSTSSAAPLLLILQHMRGERKRLCYVLHPKLTSHTSILIRSMEHCGSELILKSMSLSKQHSRETTGGHGKAG
ncbi:hypothetical protein F2Q70_00038842 [Brassica cretica]|uniref:Uncharacterized protein n=1 Tax=Brassica cretica TaxID=69181 RepID=A0A8S9MGJ3_BRACR|nr:hypothetical protein F2Q70_00038842 [Brassica cretica]KAF2619005.1 hypothetical protein F2Q68_00039528 [Brassica cretica]